MSAVEAVFATAACFVALGRFDLALAASLVVLAFKYKTNRVVEEPVEPARESIAAVDEAKDVVVEKNGHTPVSSLVVHSKLNEETWLDLHVRQEPIDSELISMCRARLTERESESEWITDACLWRYLVARKKNVDKALKQMRKSHRWRNDWNVVSLRPDEYMSKNCETGKIAPRFTDRFGRPVLVLDSSRENMRKSEDLVNNMVFHLDRATQWLDRGPPKEFPIETQTYVDKNGSTVKPAKFALFIRLENTWGGRTPPFSATKDMLFLLANVFAERLGHGVLYRPPLAFYGLWKLISPLLDPLSVSKAVWIVGKTPKKGSDNDKRLIEILGPNWRALVGEDEESVNKSAVGYLHSEYWPKVVNEWIEYFGSLKADPTYV